jgi:hypothetical protein
MRVCPHSPAARCGPVSIAQWQRLPGLEGHRISFGALVLMLRILDQERG